MNITKSATDPSHKYFSIVSSWYNLFPIATDLLCSRKLGDMFPHYH